MGLTGVSTKGIANEMIIKNAEKGATNDPNTISLNLSWNTKYIQRIHHEKKQRADLRSTTGAVPKE
jgi:hypothetical protein